jgi:hypothetical protein
VISFLFQALADTGRSTLLVSETLDVSSGLWWTTHRESDLVLCGNDYWGLLGKISARLQTSLLIQSRESHRKSSRLRTVSAKFIHGHHLQDQLISVSPDNRQTNCNVTTVASFLALPVGVAAVAKRRAIVARPNLYLRSASSNTATTAPSTDTHRKNGGF